MIFSNLNKIIRNEQGEQLAYSLTLPNSNKVAETICALANTLGGHYIFGIQEIPSDDININGISSDFYIDKTIENALKKLNPRPIIKSSFQEYKGKQIFVIQVLKSDASVEFEGIVYIRNGKQNQDTKDFQNQNKIQIFLSYSHRDKKHIAEVKDYLTLLEKQYLIKMWDDTEIIGSDDWNDVIKRELAKSSILLCFISQSFLISDYITNVEISSFLTRMKLDDKIAILPIIISHCEWKEIKWLRKTQHIPSGRTLAGQKGENRKKVYSEIYRTILSIIQKKDPTVLSK